MISRRHKFYCTRIEKCASKSLKTIIRSFDKGSKAISVMRGISFISKNLPRYYLTEEEWNKYFKFVFVRNPYSRIVSFYFHHYRRNTPIFKEIEYPFESKESFYEFVKSFKPSGKRTKILQYDFIFDHRNKMVMDYIGRIENFNDDMKIILNKLEIPMEAFPHKNKTDHKDYHIYYNDESYELVTEKFKKDIEYFNYKF